jgi:hypothetical protein
MVWNRRDQRIGIFGVRILYNIISIRSDDDTSN